MKPRSNERRVSLRTLLWAPSLWWSAWVGLGWLSGMRGGGGSEDGGADWEASNCQSHWDSRYSLCWLISTGTLLGAGPPAPQILDGKVQPAFLCACLAKLSTRSMSPSRDCVSLASPRFFRSTTTLRL